MIMLNYRCVNEVYENGVNEYCTCTRLIGRYLFTTTGKDTFHFGLEELLKLKSRSTVIINRKHSTYGTISVI